MMVPVSTEYSPHEILPVADLTTKTSEAGKAERVITVLQVPILRFPAVEGGVDAMVASLVGQLRAGGQSCAVFVPGGWDDRNLCKSCSDGVPVYRMRLRLPFDRRKPAAALAAGSVEFVRSLLRLRRMMREESIDIVHLHVAKSYQIYFVLLSRVMGVPYVLTLHGSDVATLGDLAAADRALVRRVVAGATRLTAVAAPLAEQARERFGRNLGVEAIENGLDIAAVERAVAGDHADPWVADAPERYMIAVGSLDPYKGHDLAIEAWRHVIDADPELHLVIAGEGDCRAAYEARIRELGLDGRVRLLGQVPRESVLRQMARAVGLVFPSRREGMPFVLLEAGAVGCPAICTAIPAFEAVIHDGADGLLVPLDSPEALARAVLRLAGDEALRERLGRALGERVRREFSAERMAARYLELYRQVLAEGGRGRRPGRP